MRESGEGHEPVGSVSEEAMKLFAALSDWARDAGDAYTGVAESASATIGAVDEHIATGGEDCRYCPVCRAIAMVRATSPEVRAHLASAAASLFQAAAAAMGTTVEPRERAGDPMEKVDLDEY